MLGIAIGLLYWDIFISLVGMGFVMYGRKRPDAVAVATGIVLMVYPYFFSSTGWCITVGLAVIVLYAFLKKIVRI